PSGRTPVACQFKPTFVAATTGPDAPNCTDMLEMRYLGYCGRGCGGGPGGGSVGRRVDPSTFPRAVTVTVRPTTAPSVGERALTASRMGVPSVYGAFCLPLDVRRRGRGASRPAADGEGGHRAGRGRLQVGEAAEFEPLVCDDGVDTGAEPRTLPLPPAPAARPGLHQNPPPAGASSPPAPFPIPPPPSAPSA